MCGRFAFFSPEEALRTAFGMVPGLEAQSRYNVAPSQSITAILNRDNDGRVADSFKWGLIPFWSKDPAIGNRMINARAETLAEKPSYRQAYSRRRCVIPVSGFYEWQIKPQGKQPVFICREDRQPFGLAGLWDQWQPQDGAKVLSCTIVTTPANRFMQQLHHRMPVCLERDMLDTWLAADTARAELDEITQGLQLMDLQSWPVSRRVNSPVNDSADLVEPVLAADD